MISLDRVCLEPVLTFFVVCVAKTDHFAVALAVRSLIHYRPTVTVQRQRRHFFAQLKRFVYLKMSVS